MAPTARHIDVDAFGRLVGDEEGKLSISEVARRLVRIRQGQSATPRQEENARRQIQKWWAGEGIGDLNVRRLSEALGADPEAFLKAVPVQQDGRLEPIGLMREALENQAQMKDRWDTFERRLESLVEGQDAILDGIADLVRRLERLADEQSQLRASP